MYACTYVCLYERYKPYYKILSNRFLEPITLSSLILHRILICSPKLIYSSLIDMTSASDFLKS